MANPLNMIAVFDGLRDGAIIERERFPIC